MFDRKMTNASDSVCIWVRRCQLVALPVGAIWYYLGWYLVYRPALLWFVIFTFTRFYIGGFGIFQPLNGHYRGFMGRVTVSLHYGNSVSRSVHTPEMGNKL